MRHITLELSPESCKAALDELKEYKTEVDPKLDEVCRRLAEIGAEEAQRRFDRGAEAENGGVKVTTERIENGWKIVASGHDVCFIEFGTGFLVNNPSDYDTSVPIYPGSFSEQNTQEFAKYGSWHYHGVKYQGTEAQNAMYYAGRAIRDNERRIMKEVFGK